MPEAAAAPRRPDGHFVSMEQQAHAARLGMWVFLASEMLLFAGLFALFATYRVRYPESFAEGVRAGKKTLGSLNTGVLLASSFLIARAVHAVRDGELSVAARRVLGTIALGGVFLAVKAAEYAAHFREGIYPGGAGSFFAVHTDPGLPLFWTLYFFMTGLHAVHVLAGMVLLATTLLGMRRGRIQASAPQRIEVAGVYWHLIDVVWIFLWPLFYLAR